MVQPRSTLFACAIALAVSAACSGGGGTGGGDAGPIETGLRSIPVAVYDLAVDAGDGRVQVLIGDVAAAADARGLADPGRGRDPEKEVTGWTFELSRGVDDEESELILFLPDQFQNPSFAMTADEDLGLDIGAMERFASISASSFYMLVVGGDLEVSSQLDEVADGVYTLGSGEDGEIDFEAGRAIDLIGRPVRLAAVDRNVALSISTPAIEEWIDGGDTLADEDDYLAAAQALDAAGAIGAYFVGSDFDDLPSTDPEFLELLQAQVLITEPFDLVAIGMTLDNGEPGNAITYVFGSESRANDALDEVEQSWTDAELLTMPGRSIDDLFDLTGIEADGNVVTVRVVSAQDQDTDRAFELLLRREVQFLHS